MVVKGYEATWPECQVPRRLRHLPARKFEDFRSACFLNLDKMHVPAARFDFIERDSPLTPTSAFIRRRVACARYIVQHGPRLHFASDSRSPVRSVFCSSQINIISDRCINHLRTSILCPGEKNKQAGKKEGKFCAGFAKPRRNNARPSCAFIIIVHYDCNLYGVSDSPIWFRRARNVRDDRPFTSERPAGINVTARRLACA